MRAVQAPEPGGPEALKILDLPDPVPGEGEVVVDVVAAGLNRADLMQRMGRYPPPPGASEVLGLECSGLIAALGAGVDAWRVGDRVCALLSAGGYATKVSVPAGQLLPVPAGIDLVYAAALPEVVCTVWSNVFMLAALQRGENFLVHGGGSGIGTMAIQLAKALGARVLTTAASTAKLAALSRLGADVAINYRDDDFVEVVRAETGDHGADVILDNMGAKYLERNVRTLATAGRLVIIGLQGGTKAELDLNALLRKRAAVMASSLRARPAAEKAAIVASVRENVWPLIVDGVVKPIVHTALPLDQVAEAHRLMEDGGHIGKILLTV
jgi:putative PIG3 family NAD(P)H quinone oxidoreductase